MKYGDTLRQRSIPEWGHYNIDYDYLKDLIKHQTTPGAGKALSIPGQGETTERAFLDTFFKVLKGQHERINLFIKSKTGEIAHRLEHAGKKLQQLDAQRASRGAGAALSARTVEKYARLDADVIKAGEEIRSLSRFRTVQRTGFVKILKKYRRWTRDAELEQRFKEDVSSDPDSFFELDLGYLLDQYIDVLGALRASVSGGPSNSPPEHGKSQSSADRIARASVEGSDLDFDVALSITPLGQRGGRAVYWVHVDNILEVSVLLLEHLRLRTDPTSTVSTTSSPYATPQRRKSSITADKQLSNEGDCGLIVLDDPESYARKHNSTTIGFGEETTGAIPTRAIDHARWTSSGDAALVVGLQANRSSPDSDKVQIAKLERKCLASILNSSTQEDIVPESSGTQKQADDSAGAQRWLAEHTNVKPVVGICSKRTRFIGLDNSPAGGLWATLDREIFMKESLYETLKSNDWLAAARDEAFTFPHAILEVRREGNQSASLMKILDNSHLVQRVWGFSLETHALWTCSETSALSEPIWASLLESDIRKLPAPVKRQRRKASVVGDSSAHTSPPQTSTSATSVTDGQTSPLFSRNGESSHTSAPDFMEPPPLRSFRKKSHRAKFKEPLPVQIEEASPSQRYWNEYDHPESEDEGYYIYIDPNAEVKFPGQELMENWVRKTKNLLHFGKSDAESPCLSPDYGTSDDDETADESVTAYARAYGTMPIEHRKPSVEGYFSSLFRGLRDPRRDAQTLTNMRQQTERERQSLLAEIHIRQHEREMTKLRFYSTCLAAAVVLDVILSILTMTSRRKERGVVDSAILFGTISNLLLLAVAVLSMRTRQERLGWIHQGFVFAVVLGVVVGDILLLHWVLSP
ncbi:hypothetical protein P154DRAFT_425413 [Amniculicola lignicola CBS 123094]|uniref:SPX domain-containing protein n=1 Tax=Amniculicola lignicola CBS 123094 TaxID=1392246 RepID=A0A6A5X0K5_9PLEO|nr:hypothetical protein P154DRAFT_425413 [Amniculicola lignicola CBS 123094]